MSTILRALKKLEKDAAVNADAYSLPGKGIAGLGRNLSRMPIYVTILTSVALVAGLVVFVKFHPAGLNTDAPQRLNYAANQSPPAENAEKESLPSKNISETIIDKAADRLPVKEGGKTNKKESKNVEVADALAPPVISEDIGLRIQAISWNQTPRRRIAVINSRLCREGEQINGYRILAINPDDIVVSNGEETGKLLFKLN